MRVSRLGWLWVFCSVSSLLAGCGGGETATSDPPAPGCSPLVEDKLVAPLDPPDGAAACATGGCNYQTQTGCDKGEACRPQFDAKVAEVHPGCEAAGTATSGEACDVQNDCARGYYCALGACHKLCCGADWSACDDGESCFRTLDVKAGGKVIPAGTGLCFPVGTCDPLSGSGCEEDPTRECKIVDPTGAVACVPRSTADLGDACAPPEVCKTGLNCVGGYCTKLCAYAMCAEPSCREAEGSCVHFARDPDGVGECTLGR